ncbi:Putative major facilitator superfamily, MFS transporter superfamily [Septoria linicola]|uniref:Major facilitator superfamily, MFS transporter superfamily n=1 Tax=Septoria linicola TaxID=215465 RepID=A0A9Q9EHZ7_9PEZI|nr:Putative major facilitator superfamily, MFS transporter superfamily [Septoria linicola]
MGASSSASDEEKQEPSLDYEKDGITSAISDEKDASTFVTPVTAAPAAPDAPDGGTRAWLQVAGSFLVFGNLWGMSFAFGSFQSYYELTYIPNESASSISWIGTVSIFLLILLGVASGPLFDLGWFRTMLIVGGLTETLSVFLTSVSTTYWQLMLSQGVLMGLANGLLYLPGLALVGRAFKKHRAIAMGITTCGAPVGGIIYTLIFSQLIDRLSFGWTVRIMAFVMLGTYLISFPLLLWGVTNLGDLASGSPRKLFDRSALSDAPFWLYSASNFFIFLGYMVPFVFIPSYGQLVLGISQSLSLYIAMIAQAASIFGRLIAGYTASKIGVMIPWIFCVFSSGIVAIAWLGASRTGAFIAVAALYGCFSGALIPLPPSVFPVVCPDPKVFGARLGMAQGFGSFASLIGPPIAAALANASSGSGSTNYLGLQLFAGLVMLTGGCVLILLWIVLARRRNGGTKFI